MTLAERLEKAGEASAAMHGMQLERIAASGLRPDEQDALKMAISATSLQLRTVSALALTTKDYRRFMMLYLGIITELCDGVREQLGGNDDVVRPHCSKCRKDCSTCECSAGAVVR